MSRLHAQRTRRNAAALVGTGVLLGLLMLFPTSTDRTTSPRRPGTALAPAGVVLPPSGQDAPPAAPVVTTTTVNGASVDTPYGLVQVQVQVRGGRVVAARAIDYPRGSGRDREINSQAVPVLEQETLAAQSARLDTVSGATFTSEGYRRSLQAALDAAHVG